MLRALLLLLMAFLLTAGPAVAVEAGDAPGVAHGAASDGCCPPPCHPGPGDCCDVDQGRCCAAGPASLPDALATTGPTRLPAIQPGRRAPPQRLRAYNLGPPPTPPPIA